MSPSKKAPPLAEADPMELLASLVLEDGRSWGAAAQRFQLDDAAAFLAQPYDAAPRRHFVLRGRGMSKTTDYAALALVLLLTQAPARSRSYVYAVDEDQARIFLDTLGGLVERSGLAGLVEVGPLAVSVKQSAATLTVESSSGASAFGKRPWLVIADELCMWPDTDNHRKLWSAIVSALAKVKGSRLAVTTTAGDPGGLGNRVWTQAATDDAEHWRTVRHPGPAPWWSVEDVAATRADLTAAEWLRLIECEFAAGDDALTTPEDVAACIRAGSLVLPASSGVEYVAALDVGTRSDYTALTIGHRERRQGGLVVVVDRVVYWKPGRGAAARVNLSEVEASILRAHREYRFRTLRFDRHQAEQLSQNLARQGVPVAEFVFSTAGANKIARALVTALRDRAVELPDDEEIRSEGSTVRSVQTGPGTIKLHNPPGSHDDVLTTVGMLLAHFADAPDAGRAQVTVPGAPRAGRPAPAVSRTIHPAPVRVPAALGVRAAAARQRVRIPGGAIIAPDSANDPAVNVRARSWEG